MRWIKEKIRRWLFAAEESEINTRLSALGKTSEQADIVALAREQLAGINPKSLVYDTFHEMPDMLDFTFGYLSEHEDTRPGEEEFLSQVKDLHDSEALKQIVDYLTAMQVLHGMRNAKTLAELNFARATINGITLLMGEIQRHNALYVERHRKEEEYDEHEAV